MKKLTPALAIALGTTLLVGCQDKEPTAAAKTEAVAPAAATVPAIATVNGKPITQAMLDKQIERLKSQPALTGATPEQLREGSLEAVIQQEVMVQEALKLGFDKRPELIADIEHQRRNILANALLKEQLAALTLDDALLQAEYDKHFSVKDQEFKARHILLENEDDAKAVITALDAGGDFAELAKEKSTGPTGPNGGDLGWISPDQVVPEFGSALKTMEKGKYSSAPVQTQFGWHVILLEDSREVTPPSFEQVKPQLAELKKREALQSYMQGLRGQATIEVK